MDKFFSEATKSKGKAPEERKEGQDATPKKLPKGVVLGKDGKPCRSCTSFADWAALTTQISSSSSSSSHPPTTPAPPTTTTPPPDCPPDVALLGRSTWTLLHTISATYPPRATPTEQSEMRQFLHLFGKLYPCWTCAEDFRDWMGKEGNEPRVEGREGLGRWMCEAHNEVNVKLGKGRWDCGRWEERWGGKGGDGRCG